MPNYSAFIYTKEKGHVLMFFPLHLSLTTPLLETTTSVPACSAEIIDMYLSTHLNIHKWKLWEKNKGKSALEISVTYGWKYFPDFD